MCITTKLAHPAAPTHVNISHRRTWDADKVEDIDAPGAGEPRRTCSDPASVA